MDNINISMGPAGWRYVNDLIGNDIYVAGWPN